MSIPFSSFLNHNLFSPSTKRPSTPLAAFITPNSNFLIKLIKISRYKFIITISPLAFYTTNRRMFHNFYKFSNSLKICYQQNLENFIIIPSLGGERGKSGKSNYLFHPFNAIIQFLEKSEITIRPEIRNDNQLTKISFNHIYLLSMRSK